ncbi:MAG TPA: ascorbate-dependent monooxygenase [Thermoanaerobaculia bacterium]|nr:ascorbate-dependent monooxygenase [Thermoanaerobaculia bacterium]
MLPSRRNGLLSFLGAAGLALWAGYLLAQERPQVARPRQPRVVSRPPIGTLPPTFNSEVVRILQANCQKCHHEGGIGPFPLMTYADAFSHKNDIVFQTASRKMPPWHVDSACNAFESDPSLSALGLATLSTWVGAGAPEGNPSDLPAPQTFSATWSLGDPDMVLSMPESIKPSFNQGDVYRCFVLATGLTEDRFVRAVEILPGARKMVHHVILYVDTSGKARNLDDADPGPGYSCFGGPGFSVNALSPSLGGWAPGNQPRFLPDGLGMSLPKGASVVMQVHYSAHNGIGASDQSSLGIYFTRAPVQKRVLIAPVVNTSFYIPPGASDYEVTASIPFLPFDAHLIAVTPHMHLLGTTMKVKARTQDGAETCLADVPQWDFNWQATYTYKNAVAAPLGTNLSLSARYDNSADNLRNPNDPPKGIGWGETTTDEMCIGFLNFTLDAENLQAAAAVSPERAGQLDAVEPFLWELWRRLDPPRRN